LKKNRLTVHSGFFRGFGIRRYTLLVGFTLAALNLLNLHDWYSKSECLDPWGRFLGETEPERTPRRRRRHLAWCDTKSSRRLPNPADSDPAPAARSTDSAARPRPHCGSERP
jgi:hypothetical protein